MRSVGPQYYKIMANVIIPKNSTAQAENVCLCWGITAQSTQLRHVERGQFT